MSKWGFNKVLQRVPYLEEQFLKKAMHESQKEFKRNFDTERDTERGTDWDAVLRGYPPPILDVSGELKAEAISPVNVVYSKGRAVLTIDPIDERGRGYADYHQDGIDVHQRRFVTESSDLIEIHKDILLNLVTKIFNGR